MGSGVGSPLSPSSVGFGGDGDGVEEGGGGMAVVGGDVCDVDGR